MEFFAGAPSGDVLGKEKRKCLRRAMNRRVAILRGNGELVAVCSLLDISDTGARVKLPQDWGNAELLPEFVLSLSERGNIFRQCLVVWRRNREVGVRFIGRET